MDKSSKEKVAEIFKTIYFIILIMAVLFFIFLLGCTFGWQLLDKGYCILQQVQ